MFSLSRISAVPYISTLAALIVFLGAPSHAGGDDPHEPATLESASPSQSGADIEWTVDYQAGGAGVEEDGVIESRIEPRIESPIESR